MSKISKSGHSLRRGKEVRVARWGEVGRPVLVFPTAAADAEEIERFHLVDSVGALLEAGRIKVYSVDSVAGRAWLSESSDARAAARVQNAFDSFLMQELLPAIRTDCGGTLPDIVVAGSSIGAFNSLTLICRHPEAFAAAICMSGTYDLTKFLQGEKTRDWFETSPLDFVPKLPEGPHLERLRKRFILLTHGTGRWEEPAQSWRVADVLGARGIPNRVDEWGTEWDHDWPVWRKMLPQYLGEVLDRMESEEAASSPSAPAAKPLPSAAAPAAKPVSGSAPAASARPAPAPTRAEPLRPQAPPASPERRVTLEPATPARPAEPKSAPSKAPEAKKPEAKQAEAKKPEAKKPEAKPAKAAKAPGGPAGKAADKKKRTR